MKKVWMVAFTITVAIAPLTAQDNWHSIGSKTSKAGETIRLRNLRILTTNLEGQRTPDRGETPQFNHIPNAITAREARDGWKLLWDGKTTAGWRGAKLDRFPASGWEIRDGLLTVLDGEGRESAAGGDLVSASQYANFELIVEFHISQGANSGVTSSVAPAPHKAEGSALGFQSQILAAAWPPPGEAARGGAPERLPTHAAPSPAKGAPPAQPGGQRSPFPQAATSWSATGPTTTQTACAKSSWSPDKLR